jgi:CheY-like chemotaxis protein
MSTDLPKVPKVLIVEDEMMPRMRAVDIVEDAGFSPVQAINADQALSILESRSDISLLFTDIQMPGSMDGLKLAHAVHDRWPAIKIILVSGQMNPSDAERPKDSRFFGKPLSDGQMIAELQAMVGAGALKRFQTRPCCWQMSSVTPARSGCVGTYCTQKCDVQDGPIPGPTGPAPSGFCTSGN